MKLLRITAEGLPLFKEKLELDLYAKQRVSQDDREMLKPLFSNVYLNPTNAFIGINASGKTSALKVILLALSVLNNEPLNHADSRDILGDSQRVVLTQFFYDDNGYLYCLESVMVSRKDDTDGIKYAFAEEKLWAKKASEIKTRKNLTDFIKFAPIAVRDSNEDFLPEDVSIMIARNKKENAHIKVVDLLQYTNMNVLPVQTSIPEEVITFLDPTVEYLHFEQPKDVKADRKKMLIQLKFRGKEEITLSSPLELNHYLSSGTVKGMIIFTLAKEVLASGGYMVVDEIENHFNKEIAATLMRFFMDGSLNKKRGVLIFSTHYPELLDEYERNDSIFITRNRNGITVQSLCNILKRNDIKKSDAYQSGFLEGTTPMYEAYMQLKKSFTTALDQ